MADRTILVRLRTDVAGFKQGMEEAAASSKETAAQFDRSGKRIETTGQRIVRSAEVNQAAWQRAGTTITAFGVAGVAALGLSARAAIDWESSWTGVLKTVSGTGEELAQLETDLRAIALVKPASQSEIAAVAEAAGQLGVQTKNVAAFTAVMVDLGETTNLASDEAATAIAQFMNVMQTAPENVDRVGAALVALGNNGASTERDIILMAQRIAGAGKIIGLTEGEVMGLSNALASVGIDVEAGGSAISNVMIDVSKAVSSNSADLEKWASLAGMSANAFSDAWKNDPAEALATLIEGLGKLNAAGGDVFTTLADLGQSDTRVTRALLTMANSGDLLRTSLEQGNQAVSDNLALVAEAAKRYDTTAAKADIARNALNDVAITIGEDMLPMLAQLAGSVADVAQWFGDLPDPIREVLTGMTGLVSVVALVGGGFLMLAPRVLETINGFRTLKSDMPGVASGLGKVGRAVGYAGLAGAFLALAIAAKSGIDSMRDASPDLVDTRNQLATASEGADLLSTSMVEVGANMEGFRRIADEMNGDEWWKFGATAADWVGSSIFGKDSIQKSADELRVMDKALAEFAAIDLSSSQRQFQLLAEAFGAVSEEDFATTLDALPNYRDALKEVATAQGHTADTSTLVALATGKSKEATTAFTKAEEESAVATEASAEAMQKLTDAVAAGNAAFIDGAGAYQGVIDANVAAAQAQADGLNAANDAANETRRKNDTDTVDYVTSKWEDFYDGQTVSIDDYIAKLQEQADAQTNFENNLNALNDRVKKDILPDQQGLAYEFINQLAASGPEGAAQAALLKDSTAEDLQKVVELWSQGGAQASDEFAKSLVARQPPVVVLQLDTTTADAQYIAWARGLQARFGFSSTPDLGKTSTGRPINRGAFATGGIASTPQVNIWGEGRGREAYVPLDLPLSQVDPSVRGLAAYAQGNVNSYATGGVAGGYGQLYAPHVVTVPVESRYETHAPVNVYTSASSIDGISDEARRRTGRWAGSRG